MQHKIISILRKATIKLLAKQKLLQFKPIISSRICNHIYPDQFDCEEGF